MKAIWNSEVIAESDETVVIEGNHYFPKSSVNTDYLQESSTTTICGWKGTASYYSLVVNGEINSDAVWYYATPKSAAKNIQGYLAFWKGVDLID